MVRLHRTKAEQRVDRLAAEARELRHKAVLSVEDRRRLAQITITELPKAWRAVNQARVR